jgi:NitT/TauT family transport system substrate-binding protein
MLRLLHRRWRLLVTLFLIPLALAIACESGPSSPEAGSTNGDRPLHVGVPPWPGFGSQYVAYDLNLFEDEGLEVQETFFPVQSDANTALLAGRVDLILTGIPDLITMASRDPSLKLVMLCDYSDGSDGILGRNINGPEDVRGQTIARENLLIQILMLRAYLDELGLTEEEVNIVDTPAADAASAFAAGQVDIAVTWEPFLSNAAQQSDGEIVFNSEGTNIIPDGFVMRESLIEERQDDLLAYFRAIDRATQLIEDRDEAAVASIASRLEATPEEVLDQLDGVRFFGIEGNKEVVFNPNDPMNIIDSLEFAAATAQDVDLISEPIDVRNLIDESILNAL